ncbi:hypothetical protein NC652_018334 [Populus alba x Populus x berolinensis]|nr:hypothetical protein NC652_018334 [Populus alba x Populus x berolinensis]
MMRIVTFGYILFWSVLFEELTALIWLLKKLPSQDMWCRYLSWQEKDKSLPSLFNNAVKKCVFFFLEFFLGICYQQLPLIYVLRL